MNIGGGEMKERNEQIKVDYNANFMVQISFLLSVGLVLIDFYQDGFWVVIPTLCLFLWYGLNNTLNNIILYARNNIVLILLLTISSLYMRFVIQPERISWRMPLMVMVILYLGYIIGNSHTITVETLGNLSKILFVISIIGTVWYLMGINYSANYFDGAAGYYQSYPTRLFAIYNHPLPASCVAMVAIILTIFTIEEITLKMVMCTVNYVFLFFTASRGTITVITIVLVIFAINRVIILKNSGSLSITPKMKIILSLTFIMVIILVIIIGYNFFTPVINRFMVLDLNEGSVSNRLLNYKIFFGNMIFDGGLLNKLLGRGVLSGYYRLIEFKNSMGIDYGPQYTGPLENSFLSITYDFGLTFGAIYIYSFIKAVLFTIKSKDKLDKGISLCYILLFIISMTFDMVYWINVFIFQLLMAGIMLGRKSNKK